LGQVRDLRRATIKAIIAASRQRPFTGLRDLLTRVDLHPKEVLHLIQGGGLDGLGEHRAALLAEWAEIGQGGSALQLALPFDQPTLPPETLVQRLAWERRVLGLPVSVNPLQTVAALPPEAVSLIRLPETASQLVTTAGYRLPGWTGGPGFYLGDGQTFVLARGDEAFKAPPPWQPILARGRWRRDEFGSSWFHLVEGSLNPLAAIE
jgi:hypothetical protein